MTLPEDRFAAAHEAVMAKDMDAFVASVVAAGCGELLGMKKFKVKVERTLTFTKVYEVDATDRVSAEEKAKELNAAEQDLTAGEWTNEFVDATVLR